MSAIFPALLAALSALSLAGYSMAEDRAQSKANAGSGIAAPQPGEIDAAAYASAAWPAHNQGKLHAKNLQGQKLPVGLGQETWLTEKVDLTGKVLVLDFWAVWCPPCRAAEPKFHALQEEYKGKLQVVGLSGQGEEQSTVEAYLAKKTDLNYTHVYDAQQRVYKPLEILGIPHVVVLSTDGVVRWQGNPHDKAFPEAVKQVVQNDPMIKAKAAG